jgi:hypothetical protein
VDSLLSSHISNGVSSLSLSRVLKCSPFDRLCCRNSTHDDVAATIPNMRTRVAFVSTCSTCSRHILSPLIVMSHAHRAPKGSWRPSSNISTVLQSLQLLLSEPNPDDPLDHDIADECARVLYSMQNCNTLSRFRKNQPCVCKDGQAAHRVSCQMFSSANHGRCQP